MSSSVWSVAPRGMKSAYWGTSSRSARQRFSEHSQGCEKGLISAPMVTHAMEAHGGRRPSYVCLITNLDPSPLYRAVRESCQIASMPPGIQNINRCQEWGTPRVPILLVEGGDLAPGQGEVTNPRRDWTRVQMDKIKQGTLKRICYYDDVSDEDDKEDDSRCSPTPKRPRTDPTLSQGLTLEVLGCIPEKEECEETQGRMEDEPDNRDPLDAEGQHHQQGPGDADQGCVQPEDERDEDKDPSTEVTPDPVDSVEAAVLANPAAATAAAAEAAAAGAAGPGTAAKTETTGGILTTAPVVVTAALANPAAATAAAAEAAATGAARPDAAVQMTGTGQSSQKVAAHPAALANPAAAPAAAAEAAAAGAARPGAAEGAATAGKMTKEPGCCLKEVEVVPDHDEPQVEKADGGDLRGVVPGECRTQVPPQEDGPVLQGTAAKVPEDQPHNQEGPVLNLEPGPPRTAGGTKVKGLKVAGHKKQVFASTDARLRGLDPNKPTTKATQGKDKLPKGGRMPGTRRLGGQMVTSQRLGLDAWLSQGQAARGGEGASGRVAGQPEAAQGDLAHGRRQSRNGEGIGAARGGGGGERPTTEMESTAQRVKRKGKRMKPH